MTLTANSSGVVEGKFTIPANVRAGTKLVRFQGSGGSHAEAQFVGQGVLQTNTMQRQTTVKTVLSAAPWPRWIDPLAQTFSLNASQPGLAGYEGYRPAGDLSLSLSWSRDITPALSLGGVAAATRPMSTETEHGGFLLGAGLGYRF